jgi:3-methylfumaryl-CoA hydratase
MRTGAPSTGLGEFVADWHPEPTEVSEVITARRANELGATLDLDEEFCDGDALPLLWQWTYFLDWPKTDALGPDGHPLNGHFLPPIPNRRRMFAGGRAGVSAPLILGLPTTRHSEIAGTAAKYGRTGELLFVTVRHEYRQENSVRLVEEQDLVYRSGGGSATPFSRVTEPLAEPFEPWTAEPHTHPALLFRFSALTGNAHRIHYDESYTTGTEGFPGLVVHGPLLAMYMAELVRSRAAGRIESLEFRFKKPVFVGDHIRVQGTPSGNGIELSVVSGTGNEHATARVLLV